MRDELHELVNKRQAVTAKDVAAHFSMWDELEFAQPEAHYMQSSAWAATRADTSWPVSRMVISSGNAQLPLQIFSRTVPGLGRLHYAPQICNVTPALVPALTKTIQANYARGLVFKLELYQERSDELLAAFKKAGWKVGNSVQYRDTVISDITGSEEEAFLRIKKRARYEVRVAQRNNVRIEAVEPTPKNMQQLYHLMTVTSKRSGAFFRSQAYLEKYWKAFHEAGQGNIYFAWHEKDLLASAYSINYGVRGWYKDGGSIREKSELFAPRLLQWEIIKDFRAKGVKYYDYSGVPSPKEAEHSHMKGLYVFKTGFSANLTEYMPALELPLNPMYKLWPKAEPQFLRAYSGFKHDFWY